MKVIESAAHGRMTPCYQVKLAGNRVLDVNCLFVTRATEQECKIAGQCLQLHGGAGYLYDTPISRAFVDSRVQTIYGGSNEVLKEIIARQIVSLKK